MSSLEEAIERLFPRYFIHGGTHESGGQLRVDVATPDDDCFVTGLSVYEATRLIVARNKVVNALCKVARALNDADPAALDRVLFGTDVPPNVTVQLDATDER